MHRSTAPLALAAMMVWASAAWADEASQTDAPAGQALGLPSEPDTYGGESILGPPGTLYGPAWYGPGWYGPGCHGPPPYGPYILPPLVLPAERIYGPLAVRRFLGTPPPRRIVPRLEEPDDEPKPARATSPDSIASGWRFVGFGDKHFLAQNYAEARMRYKQAGSVAPTLGAAWFRQGYVLVALGNYNEAAKVIKRGLKLDPAWPDSGFSNDQLYGPNRMAKTAHIDALAAAAADEPNNADLMFLVGVHLFFDGQPDRARMFFERSGQLGGDDSHLRPFFAALQRKAAPQL
jgi:tetratricopeptide (TPR) repeat protein